MSGTGAEALDQSARGHGREQAASANRALELGEQRAGRGIGGERVEQPRLDLGAKPALGLALALGRELARRLERAPLPADRLPDGIDAGALEGRAGQDLGRPARGRRAQQMQRRLIIGLGPARRRQELAVGLVDQDQVGELDDAALDALQLVAGARREQQRGKQSTMSATAVSLWPTPTVSITIRSKPAASQASAASRVRLVTPPSVPPAGEGRMNAAGAWASRCMRVLSPRIEPPVRRLEGSTASTAI